MPKYSFICKACSNQQKYIVSYPVKEYPCNICGSIMQRCLPIIAGKTVTEKLDSVTGTSIQDNHHELLKERNDDHFWAVEVPRLVKKSSIQTCFEQGWVYLDDKGNICVYTKPPGKR